MIFYSFRREQNGLLRAVLLLAMSLALSACGTTYRTSMNNAVSSSGVTAHNYYSYFVPKTEYSNLPQCGQFLSSQAKIILYPGRGSDIIGASQAAEQSCNSRTSQSCSIVFSEKRNFCVGQTGQCTPRYSSNIIQSTCYIDQYRYLIA
jgi:hypothetical protein